MEEYKNNIAENAANEKLMKMFLDKLPSILQNSAHSIINNAVTLRVFRDEYLELIRTTLSPSYYRSVKVSFEYLLGYFKPQKVISSINKKDVELYLSFLMNKVPKGYRVYYRNLKAAFAKGIEWEYVKVNHFAGLKLPKKQVLAPAYIDNIQLMTIISQLKNETTKEIVTTAFYTGMRLDEIINLTWRNVNLTSRTITVGDDEFLTKGRKQRFVPICNLVFELLTKKRENLKTIIAVNPENAGCMDDLRNRTKYVFCKEKGFRYSKDYISKRFKEACKAAGIDNSIHFHSLRHSFASFLVQRDVPLNTVKDLLGHTSITTTEIYSHLNSSTLHDAVKKFDLQKKKQIVTEDNSLQQTKIYKINNGV